MPIGNPRVTDFAQRLQLLGIPSSGVSDNNNGTDPYPQGVRYQLPTSGDRRADRLGRSGKGIVRLAEAAHDCSQYRRQHVGRTDGSAAGTPSCGTSQRHSSESIRPKPST